jgi:hypothetical protein
MKTFQIFVSLIATILLIIFCQALAHSQGIDVERLANAIYKAENSKAHPYGILAHYKHTTPRQACINTIKHALRDWNGKGEFIAFLGSRYCPIGAANDPKGLNKNWVKNVRRIYANSY